MGVGAGYIGQITANSFMKREFGKKLIEEFFPNDRPDPCNRHIRAHTSQVMALLRDPNRTSALRTRRLNDPTSYSECAANLVSRGSSDGLVWQAIVDQVDSPGSESEWISVADLPT